MPYKIFDELAALAGHAPGSPDGRVTISGRDPVLPTRFLLGEAAAGVHAACGLAASDLWELRTGRAQQVEVDVRAAAASLQSYMYLNTPDPRPPRPASILGFYPTRDGRWFFVHTSFPHTHQKTLELLGCPDDRESVAAALMTLKAAELEDAFAESGLCGAVARTSEEWLTHPQGQALKKNPVVEVLKIGESRPEPFPPGDRPLSGLRALDLTRVLAGPTCGRTLAEHGAEVLLINAPHLPNVDWFVLDTGHGKRSAFLDLRDRGGQETLWALIREADVFSQSYRLGALAGLGFSPEALAEARPGIVYVSMNCYGHEGPWQKRRGWEQLAQTVAGLALEHGGPRGPRLVPAAATDYTTGYLAAFGAMVALARRAREGGSWLVRASLCQSAMMIARLGRAGEAEAAAQKATLAADEIGPLSVATDTPFGRMTHLAPIVKLSETPARWAFPVVPLGTHAAAWENGKRGQEPFANAETTE